MVTCLLDEPTTPPFVLPPAASVTGGVTRSSPDAVGSWLDGRDYGEGVPVPAQLLEGGADPAAFAFLSDAATLWPYV